VYSHGDYQIVFLDTPGVIPDHNHAKMNRTLATSSWRSLDEADHGTFEIYDINCSGLLNAYAYFSGCCC
jgi:GTPase Era involved in 16S rRNA processing